MRNIVLKTILPMLSAGLLWGCIDNNYDLSDIDTEVEVKVKDLTIPINLDAIELSQVFDIDDDDDDSSIKTVNGEYAFVVDGDFHSEPVKINPVSFAPSQVTPLTVNLVKYDGSDLNIPIGAQTIAYQITGINTEFEYESDAVDKSIRDIKQLDVNCPMKLTMTVNDQNHLFTSLEFKNLSFELPAALSTSAYQMHGDIITVGDISADLNGVTEISIPLQHIDFTKFAPEAYTFTPRDNRPGTLHFKGRVGISGGSMVAQTAATSAATPQNVTLTLKIVMGAVEVLSFTGTVGYPLEGFNIPTVDLNDIPDFLTNGQTDISLYNPQLYLSVNNPLAADRLKLQTGLTLTSMRNGSVANVCPLDQGSIISIDYDKGIDGPYAKCLSPKKITEFYQGYAGAEWVSYTTLGNLLAGNGIPTQVKVDFTEPCIPDSPVEDFKVNRTIGSVDGTYTLVVPLAFNAGSKVIYSEEETGWSDDTLDHLEISALTLKATVTNSLPMDITLSGTPLDTQGHPCIDPNTGKEVKIKGFKVAAGITTDVVLTTEGTIKGIDGIRYEAAASVPASGQALRPDAPISLTNISVTVSGSYRDNL